MGGGSEGGGVYFVYWQPRRSTSPCTHTSARAPGHGAVRGRVGPGDGAGMRAHAHPECVCVRRGICPCGRRMCIIRLRGAPHSRPQPPSPADTHRTAVAGAGRGGPRPQSFPAGQTGGFLGPEATASTYPRRGLSCEISSREAGRAFKAGGGAAAGGGAGLLPIGRGRKG